MATTRHWPGCFSAVMAGGRALVRTGGAMLGWRRLKHYPAETDATRRAGLRGGRVEAGRYRMFARVSAHPPGSGRLPVVLVHGLVISSRYMEPLRSSAVISACWRRTCRASARATSRATSSMSTRSRTRSRCGSRRAASRAPPSSATPSAAKCWRRWRCAILADLYLGRLDQAVHRLRRPVEINPKFGIAYCYLAAALALSGCQSEAAATSETAQRLMPRVSIGRFRARPRGNNPVYLAQRERIIEGMRKAGVPD